MLKRAFNWLRTKEPLVAVQLVAAAVTGFVAEAQGDLTGDDAWLAVGWAVVALVSRQVVAPAAKP